MKLFLLFLLLSTISIATAESISIVDNTDFDTGNGYFITVLAGQDTTNITVSNVLEFNINNTPVQFSATNNVTISNIAILNDILNFTASANSGTLSVSSKMLKSNSSYYLYVDGTNNAVTTSNTSGWVTFNYSGWSQHDFSIQADTTPPTLTSESVSPSSVQQGNSVLISAQFQDNIAVSSAIVNVQSPDGLSLNWSLACTSGASVTCTKTYSSTVILGTYSIKYYYPQDASGNVANITSAETFQIIPIQQASQSISGSNTYIPDYGSIKTPTNPPAVNVKIININAPETQLELEITNEGNSPQEYVYAWALNLLNITGAIEAQTQEGEASKLIGNGKTESIPLLFQNLIDGTYALNINVLYGDSISKASVGFNIKSGAGTVTSIVVPPIPAPVCSFLDDLTPWSRCFLKGNIPVVTPHPIPLPPPRPQLLKSRL